MICANCYSEDISITEMPYKGWMVTIKYCRKCRCYNVIDDELEIRRLKLDKIIEQI